MATNGESDFKIKKLRDGVQVLAKQFDDLSPLMERIGQYLVRVCQVAFLNQSFDGERWPARSAPGILGIVQDLTDSPEVRESRFTDRPALVQSGALRRSIRALPGTKTVRITSSLPYAALHQHGGSSSLPVTQAVRQNLATFLRSRPNLRPKLGFLFRAAAVSAEVPARPFLGVPESSRPKLQEIARDWFEQRAREAPQGVDDGGR